MATFKFSHITADGKAVIKVEENIHLLTKEQVQKSQEKLAKKLGKNKHLDSFESIWAKVYEEIMHEFKQRPRLPFVR